MSRSSFDVLATERRWVLYRTVVSRAGAVRQGVLVDLPKLTGWLESSVLSETDLTSFLELDFRASDAPPDPDAIPADGLVYEHRFGEPFQSLSATLTLTSLPDEGASTYVYALGVLLVLASTAGLWAMYRRVATALHFSERRSNFAAAVSHELKTPLTAIRMYAEMLRDGMVLDEARRHEYLETITSESERLTRLINNVLEFSKLERQAKPEILGADTPGPVLLDALHTLTPHARSLGFEIRMQIEDGLPPVLMDRDALQQVLFNLIDNALKYARDCEPRRIDVTCAPGPTGVSIRVRDHGPGVAREHQKHLFEPFFRGESELTRRTRGTGIGLALVRQLAQRMTGEVSAQNHPEGGFEVELRLRAPRAEPTAVAPATA